MGKNTQNNQNRDLLDTQRTQSANSYNPTIYNANNDLQDARKNSTDLYSQIKNKYSDPNSFLPSGMTPDSSGWFSNPNGSGASASAAFDPNGDFASARKGYQGFADTGGAENYSEAKGNYENFANTGGVDVTALRNRATAVIPSFYKAYSDQAKTRANTQGGYSPGFDAQQEELGREQGREGFNASRQVEGDIADKVQAGKEFGTTGLYNIGSGENQNSLAGLGGLENIGQAGQQNAQFNAGLADNAAGRNLSFQQAMAQLYQKNQGDAAAGLQGLYSSSPGALNSAYSNLYRGIEGNDQNQLANISQRSQIKNKSWTDYIQSIVGAGGGIAEGLVSPGSGQKMKYA